jgi:signal transduction histidine kinase/ActR/RegA family two-component response regulator
MAAALASYVAILTSRLSRAPTLLDQGWFARVAATGAVYAACNVVTALPGASDATVVGFSRFQFFVATVHVGCWLHYSSAHLRTRSRADRWLTLALAALGASALVPGLGFTGQVTEYRFEPVDALYRTAITTASGNGVLLAIHVGLAVVLVRFVRASLRGVGQAALHAAAVLVLLLMALNDMLVVLQAYQGPFLADLGFLVPLCAGAYALGSRVVGDAQALAELRRDLETQVAERTRALAESEAARLRAEKLAALGQLSAGVAHEVNNPAAVITANLSYLREALEPGSVVTADAVECLGDSQQAVGRIAQIVRQLLDASRLATCADRPTRPIPLARAAAAALALARPRAGAAALEAAVPEELWAAGHEPLLVQVLVNLMVNGAQAIPAGRPGRVTLTARRSGPSVLLLVEDDGAGMDAETLRRVFEPFFSTKPFGAGTGLGLAVSRGLVAGMQGDLRLESAPGAGTRATVELPAAEPPGPAAAPEEPRHVPAGPRRSLLLVEDDPAVLASLGRLLGPRYALTIAAGTEQGTLLARSGRFDVILCDVMMPGGGAERLAAALDRAAPGAAARLVFFTGGATTASAQAFLAAERRPVLAKPLDLAELARIAEALAPAGEAAGK